MRLQADPTTPLPQKRGEAEVMSMEDDMKDLLLVCEALDPIQDLLMGSGDVGGRGRGEGRGKGKGKGKGGKGKGGRGNPSPPDDKFVNDRPIRQYRDLDMPDDDDLFG